MVDDLLKKIEKLLQPPKVKRKVRKYKGPMVVCDICQSAEAPLTEIGTVLARQFPYLNQLRWNPKDENARICSACLERYLRWRLIVRRYDLEKKRYVTWHQETRLFKANELKRILPKFEKLKQKYGVYFDVRLELNKREWRREMTRRRRQKLRDLVRWDEASAIYEGYHQMRQQVRKPKKKEVTLPSLQEIKEVLQGKQKPKTMPSPIEDEEELALQRLFKYFEWRFQQDEEGTPSDSSSSEDTSA
jgi:hypothetical protein